MNAIRGRYCKTMLGKYASNNPYSSDSNNSLNPNELKSSHDKFDYCENCFEDIPKSSEYCPHCGSINITRK